jgi:L-rhamnonate dehydratase
MKVDLGSNAKLEKIEWASLPGERWRSAGRNARLGVHGKKVRADLARISAGGVAGFGLSNIPLERAKTLPGTPLREIFTPEGRVKASYSDLEFPLLDWLGRVNNSPVYKIIAAPFFQPSAEPFSVPFYDTSLYFDDLDHKEEKAAVELIQAEVREGWERGHRAFKAKVGRGARFMSLQEGFKRDVAVVNGIREVIGEAACLMLDANNGYNLNLAKDFLAATRAANIFWLEEPFYEDAELFKDLKDWLAKENLPVLIADGEGNAAPNLLDWAKAGLVDVIQYDLRQYGFGKWLDLGRQLDAARVKSGPHNYGVLYGNYASAHLASAIEGFLFVEWDGGRIEGLDDSAYRLVEGKILVPDRPGFGLELESEYFSRKVSSDGWIVSMG